MRRRELANRVAKKVGLSANQVVRTLKVAMEVLVGELLDTGHLAWLEMGTFTVRTYAPRKLHDPHSGKTVSLKKRRVVTFKMGQKLRAQLKKGKSASRRSRPAKRPAIVGAKMRMAVLKTRNQKSKARAWGR